MPDTDTGADSSSGRVWLRRSSAKLRMVIIGTSISSTMPALPNSDGATISVRPGGSGMAISCERSCRNMSIWVRNR